MCEECVRKAAEIDPRILKLMADIRPEYEALQAKLSIKMREIMQMQIVDADGDEADVSNEQMAEIKETMAVLGGILGMAYAIGWHTSSTCDGPMDMSMKIGPIMNMISKSVDDGLSYNFVINQRKH